MDDIRIWRVVRSAADIYRDMHRCLTDNEPDLVASWTFEDGRASDVSGHGHTGTFAGDATVISDDGPPVDEPFPPSHRAAATATIVNGFVVGATITDAGCGYTEPPLVLIRGGNGTGATATAVVENGMVVDIIFSSAGFGYTGVPAIPIASPPFEPTVSISVSAVKVTRHVTLGRNYVLEASTDLIEWTATGPEFTAESETIVSEFDVDMTGRYFRIRQVP